MLTQLLGCNLKGELFLLAWCFHQLHRKWPNRESILALIILLSSGTRPRGVESSLRWSESGGDLKWCHAVSSTKNMVAEGWITTVTVAERFAGVGQTGVSKGVHVGTWWLSDEVMLWGRNGDGTEWVRVAFLMEIERGVVQVWWWGDFRLNGWRRELGCKRRVRARRWRRFGSGFGVSPACVRCESVESTLDLWKVVEACRVGEGWKEMNRCRRWFLCGGDEGLWLRIWGSIRWWVWKSGFVVFGGEDGKEEERNFDMETVAIGFWRRRIVSSFTLFSLFSFFSFF